jgi:hypothetical protein
MAAPLSKKIPARNFAENEPMTEMLKEKDHDHISKDIIDESRNPDEKESNVDDFLKEHLNLVDPGSADESGKEEKSENIQKAADPIEQQDDEMHNEIDETETAPFANSSEGPSENSKEQAPPSDDKESPSAENKSLNDDEKSVQKKPRLGPDIFKDIEEQFRKIEEEMHITDEDQNINTNEENDQDSGKE